MPTIKFIFIYNNKAVNNILDCNNIFWINNTTTENITFQKKKTRIHKHQYFYVI